jgi:hypothetical protein
MKKKDLQNYYTKNSDEIKKEIKLLKLDFEKTRLNISAGREKNLKKAKIIGKKISQLMSLFKIKSIESEKKV